MSKLRLEWKVGLFVLVGLALIALLVLGFSKGLTLPGSTYKIFLSAPTVGGLKNNADVQMAGVKIGSVSDIRLAPDGRSVVLALRISSQYVIRRDARFVIDSAGFLGDQYVAVTSTGTSAEPLRNGDTANAEGPFNLQDFTRSATGFISRMDETIKKLNDAMTDVTRILLNPETLTNMAVTAHNLRRVSERATNTFDSINTLLAANEPALRQSVSNLVEFSAQLNDFADDLRSLVSSNRDGITRTVGNVEASSESLKEVLSGLREGKGMAGKLLSDEEMANRASQIAANLSITTSNLNRLGLWKMLWQPKPPKTNSPPARPLTTPKASAR